MQQLGAADLQQRQQELLDTQKALQNQEMMQLQGEMKMRSLHTITDLVTGVFSSRAADLSASASTVAGAHAITQSSLRSAATHTSAVGESAILPVAPTLAVPPLWVQLLGGLEAPTVQPTVAGGIAGSMMLALGGRARRR